MIEDIKVVKFLASGTMGSVYLCTHKGKSYVLKIQQVAKNLFNTAYNDEIWREIDLYRYIDNMDKKDQSFFNRMYEYKVYNSHIQIGNDIGGSRELWEQNIKSMNISEWRVKYLLDYKGNVTLYDYLSKNVNMEAPRVYSLCLQIMYIVMLLYEGGYSNTAIHDTNIMVVDTDKKHFVFNGKNVKFYGVQLCLIDYGDVIAKKFKIQYEDDRKYAFTEEWLTRDLYVCVDLILANTMYKINYHKEHKIPLPWEKKENMTIGLKSIFKNNKKFCDKRLKKYLKIFPKGKSDIKKFSTIITTNKKISDVITKSDMHYFNIIINRVAIEFDLLYPVLYKKYYKWGLETLWSLPKEECLEFFSLTDSKSMIKWFLGKV